MEVAQDIAGIEKYAGEYLSFAAGAALALDDEDVPSLKIPPAYKGWIEFLLKLKRRLQMQPDLVRLMHADTFAGLEAIESARLKFQREHKPCPGCGKYVPVYAQFCLCGWRENVNRRDAEAAESLSARSASRR